MGVYVRQLFCDRVTLESVELRWGGTHILYGCSLSVQGLDEEIDTTLISVSSQRVISLA